MSNKINIINLLSARKSFIFIFVFFLAFLLTGLSIYKDYGISWDEPYHRTNAFVSVKYITNFFSPGSFPQYNNYPQLRDYVAKEYGVVFDLFLFMVEIISGHKENGPELYFLRHLFTFLFFYTSTFFFFLIVKNRFDSWKIGLLGCIFLILSPRIFAESFYNLKDLVFFSSFTITLYFFIRYLNNKTYPNAFLFALTSALSVNQRLPGIIIPCLAIAFVVYDMFGPRLSSAIVKKHALTLAAYIISCMIFTVVLMPYYWEDPFHNFIQALMNMIRHPWPGYVLYMGEFIKASSVPWHYIPVWLVITTPVMYTICFFAGVGFIIRGILKNRFRPYSNEKEKQDVLFLLLFFAPVLAVIVLRSVLYDGWRQMYFIFVPFLLIAIGGLINFFQHIRTVVTRTRFQIVYYIVIACMVMSFAYTFLWMVKFHPYQNVYFNLLAEKHVEKNFERDYWGLAYRKGLEYIAKTDNRNIIKIKPDMPDLVIHGLFMLKKNDATRFKLTELSDADYFITGYRWHPDEYQSNGESYSILVDQHKILTVFKLR